jgi:hypothetical protein
VKCEGFSGMENWHSGVSGKVTDSNFYNTTAKFGSGVTYCEKVGSVTRKCVFIGTRAETDLARPESDRVTYHVVGCCPG